jgi:lipopolysaccharide/colanic/teichoic acid biosynthesis glycosyltransferase
MYQKYLKRFFDILICLCLIPLFFPIMVLIFLSTWILIGFPIYIQKRPGLQKKIFKIYKFKTMNSLCDKDGNLLRDEIRLTKFGVFLRSTSLDELPTLFLVLKGDMSLVGPRPLLIEYLPLYSDIQNKRHSVRPGITGWAQVNGRNEISWEKKFEMDIWYIENQSMILDFKILFMTLKKVIFRHGITPIESKIMPTFNGSKK